MQPASERPATVRFGLYEVHIATGELWKNGHRLKLQEQPFRLLAMLLARPGELVSREELQAALWPDAEYGEFEQGLNTAIRKVRHALGDSADNPRFIETLPRKGYRFVAPVHVPEEAAAETEVTAQPPPSRGSRWPLWAGAGLLVAAIAGGVYWLRRPAVEAMPLFATPVPFTSMRGFERAPSFSPDGEQIAFSWNGENEDNFDIYIKARHSEKLVRLTQNEWNDFGPAWSPDGKRIAFARGYDNGRRGIYIVAATGGPEIKIAETIWVPEFHPYLTWSPDGNWLVFTDRATEDALGSGATPCLNLLSVVTGERRRLTHPPANLMGDVAPAFSKDGRTLAFIRAEGYARSKLYVQPLTGNYQPVGGPVEVERNSDGRVSGFAWMPDNRRLLAAKPWLYGSSANTGLWLVDTAGQSKPFHVEVAPNTTASVAVSAAGEIAYSWRQSDMNIWRVHLDKTHKPIDAPKPFVTSTMNEIVPRFSPDGKQLVFISRRSGSEEVWSSLSDGTNPVQLTNVGHAGSPSWSPDGTHIVFDSAREGQYEVYSILATGGSARRLTNHPGVDGVASYSKDGQFIYFMSRRSGSEQVWRMRADGSEPAQITKGGGYLARESADGKHLYYFKNGWTWRVPVNGGEEVQLPVRRFRSFLNFTVTEDSIYYICDPSASRELWIERFDLASQTTQKVIDINAGPKNWFTVAPDSYVVFARAGIAVSPDGRELVWAQADLAGSDIMLTRIRPQ